LDLNINKQTMKKILLSVITLTALSFGANAQNVNIPDANFKAYLVGNAAINTNLDTEIQVGEASAFTGTIGCANLGITDMTGLESFTSIISLLCQNNPLSTLDISQNTALETINCSDNNLTSLDVSQNAAFTSISCTNNNLTSIDVSQNINLSTLSFGNNNLTSIDLTQNVNLFILVCNFNDLSSLDISQNIGLGILYCTNNNNLSSLNMINISTSTLTNFDAVSNPNLTCIQVDNVALATTAWTNVDTGVSFSLNCITFVTSITVQGQAGATMITTAGGTLQLEANVLPANADDATYTWSVNSGTGSAIINTSGLLTAINDGTVTVTATANDASGITGSKVISISNQSLGVNEQTNTSNLSIYPNPVNAQLTISSEDKIGTIVILNVMGKTVKTITSSSNTIDVSELTKGIYFLKIQMDKGLVSEKFVKE
jgi:uncharacterized protein YjdB